MSYTTVTGQLLETSGAVPGPGTYVKFELRGYEPQVPRVVGTNVIVDSIEVDAFVDVNGNISEQLVDNQTITPAGTFYHITFFEMGVISSEIDWIITGASVNLSTATPSGGCAPGVALPCLCGFSIAISFMGTLTAGQVIAMVAVPNVMIFPVNLLGSIAVAGVTPTGTANILVNKNGVQFATISFAPGQANATFTGSMTTFNIGDTLSLVGPTPADSTLANLTITLEANS